MSRIKSKVFVISPKCHRALCISDLGVKGCRSRPRAKSLIIAVRSKDRTDKLEISEAHWKAQGKTPVFKEKSIKFAGSGAW